MHHHGEKGGQKSRKEKPMYYAYKRRKALRDDSVDIHELNAQTDTSSSSEETIIPMHANGKVKREADSRLNSESEDEFLEKGLSQARSHWIQLYKVNVQNQVVQQMFFNMLRDHPQTRPIWQFSRKINVDDPDWPVELGKNIQFRHHCSSIQAALTMIMDNLDDSHGMTKLLHEIGHHHFYYDAYEPHFELMHEGFMEALKTLLENSNEQLNVSLCRAWNQLWSIIKTNIGRGISNQRRNYLIQCVTPVEMTSVRKIWDQVRNFGIENCGNIVTSTALKSYNELINRYKINLSLNIDEHGEIFQKFANEVIKALEITIDYYTTDRGFEELPHVLKDFVHNCIVLDVCPTLVRKAYMEGLITMLNKVIGENAMNENVIHLWNKIYRVLEQVLNLFTMDENPGLSTRDSICQRLFVRRLFHEGFLNENQVVVPASKYDEIKEKQFEIHNRIVQLRREGKWSSTRLSAVELPSRPKTHWDFLLEELRWFHLIFRNERQARKFYAKKISSSVLKYHSTKAAEDAKQESTKNLERDARRVCGQIAKAVREFWKKASDLVELGQKELEEAQKRVDLEKELSMLAAEADKLSKTIHVDNNIEEDHEGSPKRNGKQNGITNDDQKPSSSIEMERFAEQAQSFKPKGNTLETADVQIKHPVLLEGNLREYQMIGLNWLYALYEKSMNGILADQMGLDKKTIQTIGLFAHLAAENAVWGPHLIVVPTSVILNWEMEFKKWCPSFKILTYFGSAKERAAKRKGWKQKGFFDVCITSYKLFTQDVRCFKQKQWQYLILDEAQHIKNFESQRWRSLINLRTRRRLLLTGTPLQNNLMELWSLLHFLMPNVFASREDFKDWFNNPITDMLENNGDFNSVVVQRLHKVLRPFILRRLKSEVEKQLPSKTEKLIYCDLSKRQRYLYNEFMSLRSTVDNLRAGSIVSVLNIVMQLRKCCNHPNLFEERQVQSPFCIESRPFEPFCRQLLIDKDNEFEKAVQRLPTINTTLRQKRTLAKTIINKNDDRILELLKKEMLEKAMSQIEELREYWAQDSLNKFGMYVVNALYPPIHAPFFDSIQSWHEIFKERQQNAHIAYLHRSRNELHEKSLVNSMLLFPEVRLIEYDCGKLQMLAIMLRRLHEQKHRCLIFTQMSKMLDILQRFLAHHKYTYHRLDGSTSVEKRQALVENFNSDPKVFCFILSTRAGGVGINLTGADTVIFYDSDWNPTIDAQAQDRCHRIGQTKDVTIYRLISRKTIEENILKKAQEKRRLGELAIDEAGFTPSFFKKTDNIRDLFYNAGDEHANQELRTIRIVGDENDIEKAMENAEDQQDVLDAKDLQAEIAMEESEFETPAIQIFDSIANEEFVRVVDGLRPVDRYAVHFIADQFNDEDDL